MQLSTIAQIHIVPVKRFEQKYTQNKARIESEPLNLPFWDDFSGSLNEPSPVLWEPTNGVYINAGSGLNPPSIMMATFDGLDVNGNPYSLDNNEDGLADVLTSHAIDLSALTSDDSVYISFFYQARGNGETPNSEDSIQLQGKATDGTFKRLWGIAGKDAILDTFILISVPIEINELFHNDFQFRFRSFGRQSGPYDAWHIDYVYMNSSISDFNFPDRAIQQLPGSPFNRYTAIPIDHFKKHALPFLEYPKSSAYNLFDKLQPSNFSFVAELNNLNPDLTWTVTRDTLANELPSSFPDPISTGIRQLELVADQLLDTTKVLSDTLTEIKMKLFMDTDDNEAPDYDPIIYTPLDFRKNDTISTTYKLHDYYAYDDGTAEYAAGLNYDGNMLAYLFAMPVGENDTIVAVDMYFPNFSGEANKFIELKFWNESKGKPNNLLHNESISIKMSDQVNQFIRYPLKRAVAVRDTFFVGWEHTINGNLDIGLDRNNDTGERMFFHLGDTWQLNFSVEGSLMLRPVFGNADIILGTEDELKTNFVLFPNPAHDRVKFSHPVQNIIIYDPSGRTVFSSTENIEYHSLNISDIDPGLYIIRMKINNQLVSRRLVIKGL